jgi:magnesium-transporting ATPase (P-type)
MIKTLSKPHAEVFSDSFIHKSVQEIFAVLHTGPRGLGRDEAAERLRKVGPNRIEKIRGPSLAWKFLSQFSHLMAILLWLGGSIAFIAMLPQLGVAIWLVILINGIFSFWQEYKAERALEALSRLLPARSRVLREGIEWEVAAEDLVPGDLLLLGPGDLIPADGRLVMDERLQVDQSTLSGESRPVHKRSSTRGKSDAALSECLSGKS